MRLPGWLIIIVCAFACATASCATTRVQVAYDKSADFAAFRTYRMSGGRVVPEAAAGLEASSQERISRLISGALTEKGLTESEERADLSVAYVAFTEPPHAIELGVEGDVAFDSNKAASRHESGNYGLLVELRDAKTDRLIFRVFSEVASEGSMEKAIALAVTKAMQRYPPED